jgi:hypothetical protein
MGAAGSISTVPANIFVGNEFLAAALKLNESHALRNSFINFVKCGEWISSVCATQTYDGRSRDSKFLTKTCNVDAISEFKLKSSMKGYDDLIDFLKKSDSQRFGGSGSGSPGKPGGSDSNLSLKHLQELEVLSESYVNIEKCTCLTPPQFLTVLLCILAPVYFASPTYTLFMQQSVSNATGTEASLCTNSDTPSVVYEAEGMNSSKTREIILTETSKRMRDLLLGCAAYFDEAILEKEATSQVFSASISALVEEYPIGITILDITNSTDCKFAYCNKAFLSLMKISKKDKIIGEHIHVLNGEATDEDHALVLDLALGSQRLSKIGIEHYPIGGGKPFLDLMTTVGAFHWKKSIVRRTKNYVVAVHQPAHAGLTHENIKVS